VFRTWAELGPEAFRIGNRPLRVILVMVKGSNGIGLYVLSKFQIEPAMDFPHGPVSGPLARCNQKSEIQLEMTSPAF
jgi:hypothetical protein